MDVAKGVALLVHDGEDNIQTYLPPEGKQPSGRVSLIEVTTTSGTGSEVNWGAALSDTRTGHKLGIMDPILNPDAAVVDPELTLSCPPQLTASVGLDAFAHALEAFLSRAATPLSDALCWHAMELAAAYLPKAVYHGYDRRARVKMSQASMMAGLGFPGKLWYGHGLGVVVSDLHHTQHGFTLWATLPALLEFSLPAVEEKLARVGLLFGLDAGEGTPREVALATVSEISAFAGGVGAPTLAELTGCGEEMIDDWVRGAMAIPPRFGAPIQLTDGGARRIFESSLYGYAR